MHRNTRHRPPRLERVFSDVRPLFFVTFNTHQRRPLLANRSVHDAFQTFARRSPERGAVVGRYVLMPDHAHIFVALSGRDIRLSDWVRALRRVLGKTLLRLGHPKPHWQEGFFDHLLRSDESYSEKWEYVRMNPVRARLVEKPEDWPFQGEIEVIRF